jgi:hypothetical protein
MHNFSIIFNSLSTQYKNTMNVVFYNLFWYITFVPENKFILLKKM